MIEREEAVKGPEGIRPCKPSFVLLKELGGFLRLRNRHCQVSCLLWKVPCAGLPQSKPCAAGAGTHVPRSRWWRGGCRFESSGTWAAAEDVDEGAGEGGLGLRG